MAKLIHPWLHGLLSYGLAFAISLTIAYVLTTAVHITLGEQVPKLLSGSVVGVLAHRGHRNYGCGWAGVCGTLDR